MRAGGEGGQTGVEGDDAGGAAECEDEAGLWSVSEGFVCGQGAR